MALAVLIKVRFPALLRPTHLEDDVTGFGDRLTKAAQAAWDILTDTDHNTPEN